MEKAPCSYPPSSPCGPRYKEQPTFHARPLQYPRLPRTGQTTRPRLRENVTTAQKILKEKRRRPPLLPVPSDAACPFSSALVGWARAGATAHHLPCYLAVGGCSTASRVPRLPGSAQAAAAYQAKTALVQPPRYNYYSVLGRHAQLVCSSSAFKVP